MLIRQHIQLHQLVVGDHVPRRVGGTRYADHARLFTDMQMFKIDVIFELALWQQLDIRTCGNKQVFFEAGIGIADIPGASGNSTFRGAVGAASGEQIE